MNGTEVRDLYNMGDIATTLADLGYQFRYVKKTTSTMDLARRAGNIPTSVIAETQDNGRGRNERSWFDQPYMSILMTIAEPFNETDTGGDPGLFSPLTYQIAALAFCTALREQTSVPIRIKWPNDLVFAGNPMLRDDGRKIGGVLLENPDYKQDETYPRLIGVGVNVYYKHMESLVSTDYGAVSLSEVVSPDMMLSRTGLVLAMMRKWSEFRPALRDMSDPEVFSHFEKLWKANSMLLKKKVKVTGVENDSDRTIEGLVVNTPLNGGLLIATAKGVESVDAFKNNTRIQIIK